MTSTYLVKVARALPFARSRGRSDPDGRTRPPWPLTSIKAPRLFPAATVRRNLPREPHTQGRSGRLAGIRLPIVHRCFLSIQRLPTLYPLRDVTGEMSLPNFPGGIVRQASFTSFSHSRIQKWHLSSLAKTRLALSPQSPWFSQPAQAGPASATRSSSVSSLVSWLQSPSSASFSSAS